LVAQAPAPKPAAPTAAPAAPGKPAAPAAAPGKPAAPAAAAPGTPAAAAAPLNKEQETEALFSEATAAFNQGKFDVALQKIGAIHVNTSNKDNEPVMFLEGACHFNLKNYDKAVSF